MHTITFVIFLPFTIHHSPMRMTLMSIRLKCPRRICKMYQFRIGSAFAIHFNTQIVYISDSLQLKTGLYVGDSWYGISKRQSFPSIWNMQLYSVLFSIFQVFLQHSALIGWCTTSKRKKKCAEWSTFNFDANFSVFNIQYSMCEIG